MTLYLGTNLISGVAYPTEPTRNLGQIIESILPLTDAGLHLLDGALIHGDGIYSAFVDYMAKLYNNIQGKDLPFVQPVLSANGTMGGNYFAVSASSEYSSSYQAYMAFDSSTSSEWATQGTHNPSWITFYNPNPLNVTLLTMRNRTSTEAFTGGNIYGSNDNSTWELLTAYINSTTTANATWTIDLSSNTNYYNYYKIEGTSFTGTNQGFTNIAITATYQTKHIFCIEEDWQTSVNTYGVCGKFVYDSVNNTVRLPKVTGIIEGTTDLNALGDLVEAGLPISWLSHTHTRGTMNITGYITSNNWAGTASANSALYPAGNGANSQQGGSGNNAIGFDASRSWSGSTSTPNYTDDSHDSSTVQPQTIKMFYYIVIATTAKTDIEVDIDEVTTDLNNKVDLDGTNATFPHIVETYVNGTSWYNVYSNGWCEQGGTGSTVAQASNSVALLKAYTNTNYTLLATNNFEETGGNVTIQAVKTSNSEFNINAKEYNVNTYYARSYCWYACGYIR